MNCEKKGFRDCFDIGTRLCNDVEHDSYIEEVSGISAHLVKALREDQTQSFLDFVEQVKRDTWSSFKKEVEWGFGKQKKFNHIVSQTEPYSIDKERRVFKVKGIEGYNLTMPYEDFVELRIAEIGLYAKTGGDGEFLVIDLSTGETLYRQEIKIEVGKQKIAINTVIVNDFSLDLFIGIKSDTAVFFDMACKEFKPCCQCLCETQEEIGRIQNCEGKSIDNIEWIANKAFCLKAEIGCNFEDILCEYAKYFIEARNYSIAIKILEEKLNSYQRGWFSDANVETVREQLLPDLKTRYYELIGLAITNIKDIMDGSICWECDSLSATHPMIGSI
jgi:hypothetical protein